MWCLDFVSKKINIEGILRSCFPTFSSMCFSTCQLSLTFKELYKKAHKKCYIKGTHLCFSINYSTVATRWNFVS